jgi:hypothetical protein
MADNSPTSTGADLDGLGWAGHSITAGMGVMSIIAAFGAWSAGIQPTLIVSLLIVGALLPILTWKSLHKSRAAWSFLISLATVLGIMTLFGAPKIRDLVGVQMIVALLIPGLLLVCVFLLSTLNHRYKD